MGSKYTYLIYKVIIFCLILFLGINCLFPKNVEGIGLSLPLKCYKDDAFDAYFQKEDGTDLTFNELKGKAILSADNGGKIFLSESKVNEVKENDINELKRLITTKVAKNEDIDQKALVGFPCTDLPNVEGWIDFKNEQKKNWYSYNGKGYNGNLSKTANGNECKEYILGGEKIEAKCRNVSNDDFCCDIKGPYCKVGDGDFDYEYCSFEEMAFSDPRGVKNLMDHLTELYVKEGFDRKKAVARSEKMIKKRIKAFRKKGLEVANESDLNQFISADVGSGKRVKKVSKFKQLVQKPGIRLGTTYRDKLEGMDARLLKRELRKLQPGETGGGDTEINRDKLIKEVIEAKTTTLYQKDTETLKVQAKQIDETIKEDSTREEYINVINSNYRKELEEKTDEELEEMSDSKKLTKNELIERIIFVKTKEIKESNQGIGEKEILKKLNKEGSYVLSGDYTIAEATSIVNGMWLKDKNLIGKVKNDTNIKSSSLSDKITGFTFRAPLVNAMKGDKIHIYFVGYLPEMTPDPLWNSYITVEDEGGVMFQQKVMKGGHKNNLILNK